MIRHIEKSMISNFRNSLQASFKPIYKSNSSICLYNSHRFYTLTNQDVFLSSQNALRQFQSSNLHYGSKHNQKKHSRNHKKHKKERKQHDKFNTKKTNPSSSSSNILIIGNTIEAFLTALNLNKSHFKVSLVTNEKSVGVPHYLLLSPSTLKKIVDCIPSSYRAKLSSMLHTVDSYKVFDDNQKKRLDVAFEEVVSDASLPNLRGKAVIVNINEVMNLLNNICQAHSGISVQFMKPSDSVAIDGEEVIFKKKEYDCVLVADGRNSSFIGSYNATASIDKQLVQSGKYLKLPEILQLQISLNTEVLDYANHVFQWNLPTIQLNAFKSGYNNTTLNITIHTAQDIKEKTQLAMKLIEDIHSKLADGNGINVLFDEIHAKMTTNIGFVESMSLLPRETIHDLRSYSSENSKGILIGGTAHSLSDHYGLQTAINVSDAHQISTILNEEVEKVEKPSDLNFKLIASSYEKASREQFEKTAKIKLSRDKMVFRGKRFPFAFWRRWFIGVDKYWMKNHLKTFLSTK